MKKIVSALLLIWWVRLLWNSNSGLHIYGILCLLSLSLLHVEVLQNFLKLKDAVSKISVKDNANCQFDIVLNIDEILKNEILINYLNSDVFDNKKYKKNFLLKKAQDNAKKMIKNWDITNTIQINIKNWNIYKNWNIIFEDTFYHDMVFLPGPSNIRIFLINWYLKLQIWNLWSWSINKIKNSNVYKNAYDLASIPLMYYMPKLNISKKHLNIVDEGMDEFYSNDWKGRSNERKVWHRQLYKDLEDYFTINAFPEEFVYGKKERSIIDRFYEKWIQILNEQNIKVENYNDFRMRRHMTTFSNNLLSVTVSDWNKRYEEIYKENSSGYEKN